MPPSSILWLDYETASELDLKKVGADRYSRHSSTRAMMLGWAVNDAPARVWDIDADEAMPRELEPFLLHQQGEIRAHNAPFEMMITDQVLSRSIFIPPTVPEQWKCSQVMAYGMSFVRGLGEIIQQIGLPSNVEKDKRGRRLIQIFCKRQPKTHHIQWHDRDSRPDEWVEFLEYCRQDIEAMRAMWQWCERFNPISEEEWTNWCIDRRINQAGIPVDMDLVDRALAAMASEKVVLENELHHITGLDRITRVPLLKWLEQQLIFQGLEMPNMQKATKEWTVERCEGPAKAALEASLLIAQASSSSKWNAFKQRTDPDTNLLRETLQFAGAQRTRRWAGRGVQLQNMKRSTNDMEADITSLLAGAQVSMGQISTSIRGAIKAPPGKDLVVSDLSSIESRLAGWLTGCRLIMSTFDQGLDTYKVLATRIFGVAYDEVTKEQRTLSKPAALGCQYMLGAGGLVRYAKDYGVEMTKDEAASHVKTYRAIYPELPEFWNWIKASIAYVLETPRAVARRYYLKVYLQGDFLFIDLPSGRRLSYFQPSMEMGPAPWDATQEIKKFTFMGTDTYSQKWTRINAHAGGILENIIQAIARDIQALWIRRVHGEGGDIRMHVHDELVLLSDKSHSEATLRIINATAARPIPWAPGLKLTADGYIAERYRKD